MIIAGAAVILLIAAAVYLITRSGSAPKPVVPADPLKAESWLIGPIVYGKNDSIGLPETPAAAPDGIFSFEWQPHVSSAHYLTYLNGPLTGKSRIRMKLRLDLDPGAVLYGTGCPETTASAVTIYLQRRGDDESAIGKYETFRWWATFVTQSLHAEGGEFEIVAPLDDKRWSAVLTSNAADQAAAFQAALDDCESVGFTFANCVGFGHGGSSTGHAKFTLLEWVIE